MGTAMTEPKFQNRTGGTGGRGSLRPSRDRRLPHLADYTLVGNSFRSCVKRVSCRSRRVKRTCGVDSKSGPGDSQTRLPRSLLLSSSCVRIPGSDMPIKGERKWTGVPFQLHRNWGQRAEMRPAVSERYVRYASRVEEFRG